MATTPKTAKTEKTEVSAREVIRARAAELRAGREEKIVPPATVVEVAPVASVEVAPTVVEFTAPAPTATTEENTMNDMNTPDAIEVPDAAKIGELLDLHDGISSDIEALEAKLEELEARRDEVYGSLDIYRAELDGSKLTDEQAQEKLAEVKAGMMAKFGPMAKFIVPALFEGFSFAAPASLDLDPETGARLCELLEVGNGSSGKADYGPMVRELTAHVLSVAEASEMTDTVKPKLNAVLLEMGLVRMAPPVAAKTTGQREGKREKLGTKWIELPGYPDKVGYAGANASVIVKADGSKGISFGGQTVPRYLDRVGHPSPERAKAELMTIAAQWAQGAGLLP